MIPTPLAQLTELQRAVRDQFQEGGSAISVLIVVGGLVVLVLVVKLLAVSLQRRHDRPNANEPYEFFDTLTKDLELTPPQLRFLHRLGRELALPHPAVVVLSPTLYDRYVATWQQRAGRNSAAQIDAEFLRRLRSHLFPDPYARVSTKQMNL